MAATTLMIGDVSARTGTKIPTIRYYETIGVLETAPRSGGGHRLYTEEDVRRLVFIRKSRDLGFTLGQVQSLIHLSENIDWPCAAVDELASLHLDEIRAKLRQLSAMRDALESLLEQCAREAIIECRVIEALSGDTGFDTAAV